MYGAVWKSCLDNSNRRNSAEDQNPVNPKKKSELNLRFNENQHLVCSQNVILMIPKLEPMTWSFDTGQWLPCFDSCQLTIT